MAFKYTPQEWDDVNWKYYSEMCQTRHEFPSLPGVFVFAKISRSEYDKMTEDPEYAEVIEKYVNLRADYCMRMQKDAKSANGFARLLALPENGGISDKNDNITKKVVIEIREFLENDDVEILEE